MHKTFFVVNGDVHCSEPIPAYPHCRLIHQQWGSYSCKTATTYNLPTTFKNICYGGCISGFGIANNIINREIRVSTSSVTIYNNLTNNEVIGNFIILLGK